MLHQVSKLDTEDADETMPDSNLTFTYDVFVSYSHSDKDWVRNWLVPRLKNAGLRVCIDYESFVVGKPAIMNMEDAVTSSRHTLLVLTPAWNQSEYGIFESLITQHEDPAGFLLKTVPLMLKPCSPPPRIAMLTYANFTGEVDQEIEFARLLSTLRSDSDRPTDVDTVNVVPVFDLLDRDWIRFTQQMQVFARDRERRLPLLFFEVERKLANVSSTPSKSFHEMLAWQELQIAVRNLLNYHADFTEEPMKALMIENINRCVEDAATREMQAQNWHCGKALYELCLLLYPDCQWIIHGLELAKQKIEELNSIKSENYFMLQQAIRDHNDSRIQMILQWFMDTDPNYEDMPQLLSRYGRRSK